jgi:hypothetical protein
VTSQRFTLSAAVRTVAVDDNLVLVDQKSGQYFGLNEIGREIWRRLEEGCDMTAIIAALVSEYEAPEEVIAADTQRMVSELVEAGLIT